MHNLNAVKSLLLLANMLQYVVLTCRLSLTEINHSWSLTLISRTNEVY